MRARIKSEMVACTTHKAKVGVLFFSHKVEQDVNMGKILKNRIINPCSFPSKESAISAIKKIEK